MRHSRPFLSLQPSLLLLQVGAGRDSLPWSEGRCAVYEARPWKAGDRRAAAPRTQECSLHVCVYVRAYVSQQVTSCDASDQQRLCTKSCARLCITCRARQLCLRVDRKLAVIWQLAIKELILVVGWPHRVHRHGVWRASLLIDKV